MSERAKIAVKTPETKRENAVSKSRNTEPSQSIRSPIDRILFLQRTIGNQAVGRLFKSGVLQAKLKIGQPNDIYEQEADSVAEQVMRMPEPTVQKKCAKCNEEEEIKVQRKAESAGSGFSVPSYFVSSLGVGQPLDKATRNYFEPRFGMDFSQVRIHSGPQAAESSSSINALAYTLGSNVVFGTGQYAPETTVGQKLMAHELTHVVQQSGVGKDREQQRILSPVGYPHIQRTIGDGHDLTSPRFLLLEDLEAAYDDEKVISTDKNSSGRGVQAIQQALYDLGYPLPAYGADGKFGSETKAAVKAFQRDNPPLVEGGKVEKFTMAALDAKFGTPVLPAAAARSAPWTETCVRSVLCPWSPHTIDVLRTRITLKSFDSISWADEEWDGAAWIPAPFPGGGYNTNTEIGVLNSSCEEMSETLYHEVLHAEQPTTHRTTREKESYAYRIGEEFSIAMGLGGRPDLRSTDVQGREYADPTKVGAFVAATYPSVPAGGGGDEIIGKAVALGEVRVRRPNGSIYARLAAVGEKVPGTMTTVNEVTHPTAGWTCP